jgi:bifunctional DNase/RNase
MSGEQEMNAETAQPKTETVRIDLENLDQASQFALFMSAKLNAAIPQIISKDEGMSLEVALATLFESQSAQFALLGRLLKHAGSRVTPVIVADAANRFQGGRR